MQSASSDRILSLIMAGGASETLGALTEARAEPALHIGGKFRLIDFPLSNLTNSELYNIGVLTQYMPRSLNDHIGVGKPWDLDRATGGVRLLQPYMGGMWGGWQSGNADAVRRNLDFIRNQGATDILILAGDHMYLMDYRPMLQQHMERGSEVTVGTRHITSPHDAFRYGMLVSDQEQRLLAFEEKPGRSRRSMSSMGIYVFDVNALADALVSHPELNDFGRDVIPWFLERKSRIHTYEYKGYWADVGTVQAYWEANMGLIADEPALNLYNRQWVVRTRSETQAAARIEPDSDVSDSLVSNGCRVGGTVRHSVLSPGVVVEAGARVTNSVVLRNVHIGADAVVDRCVIDDDTVIGAGALVGHGADEAPNRQLPDVLNTGLTLIGLDSQVPPGYKIGRNVQVHSRTGADGFPSEGEVVSGDIVGRDPRRQGEPTGV